MSRRFWFAGAGVMGVSIVVGATLGHYVTQVPEGRNARIENMAEGSPAITPDDSLIMESARGPDQILCKGCGPTLAERRQMADMAGLDADGMIDGSSDPVVRNYMRDPPIMPDAAPPPPPPPTTLPSQVHRLPPNVERFAAGEGQAPRPLGAPASVVTIATPDVVAQDAAAQDTPPDMP